MESSWRCIRDMLRLKATFRKFITLLAWELEEIPYLLLGTIVFSTTIYVLYPGVSHSAGSLIIGELIERDSLKFKASIQDYLFYPSLIIDAIEPLAAFLAGILFATNVARTFENKELQTLLTCPVKRTHVILSKFCVNYSILYISFAIPFLLDMILLGISSLSLDIYIWLLILAFPILFACSLAIFISVTLKMSAFSAVLPPLIYFGLSKALDTSSEKTYMLLYSKWDEKLFKAIQDWITLQSVPQMGVEFLYIFLYRFLLPVLLLAFSVIYFDKILQLD